MIKQYESAVFLSMTSDTCLRGFFQLNNENPILSKTEHQQINTCEHPVHQVNVFSKGVLCTPDSSKFFETPCVPDDSSKELCRMP